MKAQKWKVRPSELLGIDDAYVAWCLDEAVTDFSTWIESELDKVKLPGKKHDAEKLNARKRARLLALLSGDADRQFADPMAKARH